MSAPYDLAALAATVRERPGDARARFEYAGALDYLAHEAEAAREYELVYRDGMASLEPGERMRLYVQYGSTLRNLNQLERSAELLEEGMRLFPAASALPAFLALTQYSRGDRRGALCRLLDALLDSDGDGSAAEYRRALRAYAAELEP